MIINHLTHVFNFEVRVLIIVFLGHWHHILTLFFLNNIVTPHITLYINILNKKYSNITDLL